MRLYLYKQADVDKPNVLQ